MELSFVRVGLFRLMAGIFLPRNNESRKEERRRQPAGYRRRALIHA
jgi:hypothetical protein